MKKTIRVSHRIFVNNFWKLYKKNRINNLHVVFELASLICGNLKIFDFDASIQPIVALLKEFAANNSEEFFVNEVNGTIYLGQKKYFSLFKEFTSKMDSTTKSSKSRTEELYGLMMGFPESATTAWKLDTGLSNNDRQHLLNFYSCVIVDRSFSEIGLMNFVYSKSNWQEEFKFKTKIELHVCQTFPEIFTFIKMKKNAENVANLKSMVRTKNLFAKMKPLQKALFLACKSNEMPHEEKNAVLPIIQMVS